MMVAAVLTAGSVALALVSSAGGSSSVADPVPPAPHRSAAAAHSGPGQPVPSSPSPALSQPAPSVDPETVWTRALLALDATRSVAYADRQVSLLGRVYASPALLHADAARLRSTVPVGCGLRGVRTAYRVLAVAQRGNGATLLVDASLASSTLVCRGSARASAPSTGPVQLRVAVARTADGPRITALRTA